MECADLSATASACEKRKHSFKEKRGSLDAGCQVAIPVQFTKWSLGMLINGILCRTWEC